MKDTRNPIDRVMEDIITQSWTWERLAEEERQRFFDELNSLALKGRYKVVFRLVQNLYGKFLLDLGYSGKDYWRKDD